MDLLSTSIGVGLAVSLLFSEVFGLAAGGMVVPGYVALYLNRPADVLLTVAAALMAYFIIHALSTFLILYGKRRTVLTIIMGFLVRDVFDRVPFYALDPLFLVSKQLGTAPPEFSVIGFVIPGLIAIWMDR